VGANLSLSEAISRFGAAAKAKLDNPAASGEPEDQLRAPLETLVADIGALIGLAARESVLVGESSQADLMTRPDYVRSSRLPSRSCCAGNATPEPAIAGEWRVGFWTSWARSCPRSDSRRSRCFSRRRRQADVPNFRDGSMFALGFLPGTRPREVRLRVENGLRRLAR